MQKKKKLWGHFVFYLANYVAYLHQSPRLSGTRQQVARTSYFVVETFRCVINVI